MNSMQVIQKVIKVDNDSYHRVHLNIINSVFPVKMTEKEMDILSEFMKLDYNITQDDMFNTLARKKVKESLRDMTASSLSNHLGSLLKKGFLLKNEVTGKIKIVEYLFPEENNQGYQFKIIRK